jgi:virulence factor Mce-like protein
MNPNSDKRLADWQIGLIAVLVTVIAFYLAFAKSLPFSGDGYQLKAVFDDAQSLRAKSPVRIAGVQVGEVTEVEHVTDSDGNGLEAAMVTMKLDDDARPIREDVTVQLRPRLFLEGNLFLDMQPGSPGTEELESGSVIPIEQTSVSVQFDQVLTTLQAPVREDLQLFLKEFGDALDKYGGAEGFRESFRTSGPAYRYTSQVNEAFLGTEPGDLAGVIRNFDRVAEALTRDEVQLQDLITNLRIVTGSFAAEDESLELAIAELPRLLAVGRPALAKLNADFPALRAFAREAIPGVKAADKALPAATPWIGQMRRLVSRQELRGLVKDLRPTIPNLARLAQRTIPFLEQGRALSSCFNLVVLPWSNTTVPATELLPTEQQPVYKSTGHSLAGVAGESRSGDAQGEWFRVLGGGGSNTFSIPSSDTGPAAGVSPFSILGAQPAKQSSAKTPFRPDIACETQDLPNLNSDVGTAPSSSSASSTAQTPAGARVDQLSASYASIYSQMLQVDALRESGATDEARKLEREVNEKLRDFTKHGLPAYREAIAELTGGTP